MQRCRFLLNVLVLILIFCNTCAIGQVTHQAEEGNVPLKVGFGISDYSIDWGHSRRMIGISAWANWGLKGVPPFMRGTGIEIEGHHIAYDRPSGLIKMKQDSGLGGVTYEWRHYDRVRPYGKFMIGFGSIDFDGPPNYTHDTRTILAPGGGVDVRVWRSVFVRADYEYQFWRQIFGPHDLNPQGFTIGAAYDFGRRERPSRWEAPISNRR